MNTPETTTTAKKEEVTIKFGEGLVGKPFMAKTGKECVGIKIPNADPADKTPWEASVVPSNRVHEDKFGKGMWMKVSADGQTRVSRSVITGQDENGKNYVDSEMMNSMYFKYFGLQQVTTIPWDDMQRGLEQSALRERGYIHEDASSDDSFNIYDALKDAFASNGTEEFHFYGEDKAFSLDEWVQEIIRRAHMGLMDSLFPR